MDNSKPRSQRQLKVGEEIRRVLADAFLRGDFHVFDQKAMSITVSEVRISPDLKNATVFVMPLAGRNAKDVMEYLQTIMPEIKRIVAKKLMLRLVPRLKFVLDDSFEQAHKMNTLLNLPEVVRDIKKPKDTE